MSMRTEFTQRFGLAHPIALAPMGGVSGGALTAAVSNAGGLGLLGGGYGDAVWLERELEHVAGATSKPWGVGGIAWHISHEIVELTLRYKPSAFMLSFGDARPYVDAIKRAGCVLICQVQEVALAREAKALGADFIVAQGTEAGGHGAQRGTLPLVPAVVDAVHPIPVLAAGGISDGRGVAAALALGACGALIGTAFCVAEESMLRAGAKQRLVEGQGAQTVRTRVFDTARGYAWPKPFTGRALANQFTQRWHDRDEQLAGEAQELERYRQAAEKGDFNTALVWAGEGVDLVTRVEPAANILQRMVAEAETALRHSQAYLR